MSLGPKRQSKWDWRAAGNFIGGGSGSGLLIVTTLGLIVGAGSTALAPPAALLIAAGLGLVWLEIGRKGRFLNVFHNPRTSWMSREAYVAVALLPLALLTGLTGSAALMALTALVAGLFLYCQGRILKASRGIPAWRVGEIVPLILSTGIAEGFGLLLIALAWSGPLPLPGGLLAALVIGLAFHRQFSWRCYAAALRRGAPDGTLQALPPTQLTLQLLGTGLPVVTALLLSLDGEQQRLLAATAGVGLTLGGWLTKFSIVTRLAFDQGYAIPITPARGGRIGPGGRPGWRDDHDTE